MNMSETIATATALLDAVRAQKPTTPGARKEMQCALEAAYELLAALEAAQADMAKQAAKGSK